MHYAVNFSIVDMNFPKRIKQHKNESDSLAIIMYKFKELGIFRNVTNSDYGVDFEIEVVNDDRVEGHCIKVQVKASETGLVRKRDGHARVSGIKQTTLSYWAELSYRVPVVGMAVNLKDGSEAVYVSKPLFWQAIRLMDGSERSKTIDFGAKCDVEKNTCHLRKIAAEYSLRDFLYAHKWVLSNIKRIFQMYEAAARCDGPLSIYEPELFRSFLEHSHVIFINFSNFQRAVQFDALFSYERYVYENNGEDPSNYQVSCIMKLLLPLLIGALIMYREEVLGSTYYWVHKDPSYLKIVYATEIPPLDDLKKICNWVLENADCSFYDHSCQIYDFLREKENAYGLEENSLVHKMP